MGKGLGTIAGGVIGGAVGFVIGGPAGAVALGAAGAQAGAGLDGAAAEKAAAKKQKSFNDAQADEVLRRAYSNMEATRIEGEEAQGNQSSQFAGSGVQVGSLSSLVAMENTAGRYREEMNNIYLDAKQTADSIRFAGQAAVDMARKREQAAVISGGIGVVGAAGNAYMKTPTTTSKTVTAGNSAGQSSKSYSNLV